MVTLNHYLILSAILFSIGTAGVFVRRNLITILLSIEIMLNAVNLTFVAVGRYRGNVDGQIITFFVMTVAAAEAAVGSQANATTVSSVREMGKVLFSRHAFAFEATSVLILVAMVGAVVLARREGES